LAILFISSGYWGNNCCLHREENLANKNDGIEEDMAREGMVQREEVV
jgi:hypothetical protein